MWYVTRCLVPFRFSHHCSQCEFDVCHNCFKPHDTPLHPHPLYRADSHFVYEQFSGGWRCDNCSSVHNNPTDNKPWHCQTCEYDLCHSCMSGTIEGKIRCNGIWTCKHMRELKHARFLRRGRQPEENISRARKVLSPRFLYYSSLMEKRYLALWMWLCEG